MNTSPLITDKLCQRMISSGYFGGFVSLPQSIFSGESMRVITIDHGETVATYPLHQVLYIKWIPLYGEGVIRFQGDLTTYTISGDEYDNLMAFITHSKDLEHHIQRRTKNA